MFSPLCLVLWYKDLHKVWLARSVSAKMANGSGAPRAARFRKVASMQGSGIFAINRPMLLCDVDTEFRPI